MATRFKLCTTDDDFSKASIFLLENCKDIHPSYTTLDVVSLVYSYVTQGHIIIVLDDNNQIVGFTAYYLGTKEEEFKNKEIAYVDVAILSRAYRRSRAFYEGLRFLISHIIQEHREVKEIRLAALKENRNICRLYSKFSNKLYEREGVIGLEEIYGLKISNINTIPRIFNKI